VPDQLWEEVVRGISKDIENGKFIQMVCHRTNNKELTCFVITCWKQQIGTWTDEDNKNLPVSYTMISEMKKPHPKF
jgi:hypothetical protein